MFIILCITLRTCVLLYEPSDTSDRGVFRALSNISDEANKNLTVTYFCKMLDLRCLTGLWIRLCLRLRSLKLYLFPQNTNFVLKSLLLYQFWKLFIVVIGAKSHDSIIVMSIIFWLPWLYKLLRKSRKSVFILKNILRSLDAFNDIWVKFKILSRGWR